MQHRKVAVCLEKPRFGIQADLVGRTFRHFKGNLYRLEGFAKDSEMLEKMVVYRALYGESNLSMTSMFFHTNCVSDG